MQLNNCYGGFDYVCACLFSDEYYEEPKVPVVTNIIINNYYYTYNPEYKQNTSTNLTISDLIRPIEYYGFLQNT